MPSPQQSFIPDKMPSVGQTESQSGGLVDLFFLVSIIGLAVSLALSAGVFLYHQFLSAQVEKKQATLQKGRASLEPETIRDLMRIDARLNSASEVLESHLAPSELLRTLGTLTLKSIWFKEMSYKKMEDGNLEINLLGHADSVNGVALQADTFAKSIIIKNPIFSDLSFAADGVSFNVRATIEPSALKFVSLVNVPAPQTEISTDEFGVTETGEDDFGEFSSEE